MAEMVAIEKLVCRSAPWKWATRKVVVPWALQGEVPAGRALEIGAGSGLMAAEMLRRFQDLELIVTDFDDEMLEHGREILGPFAERARVEQADATSLSFDDGHFDYVFSFLMLHHVLDWEKTVHEALRVLRPGGWFVGFDILDSFFFRTLHRLGTPDVRLMRYAELSEVLDSLAVDRAVLERSFGRRLIRFRIRKSSDIPDHGG